MSLVYYMDHYITLYRISITPQKRVLSSLVIRLRRQINNVIIPFVNTLLPIAGTIITLDQPFASKWEAQ